MATNNWRVLLIGGNSGAGKTLLAKELVRQWGIPFLMVDDVRIGLQNATTSDQNPDLHVFLKYQPEQWKDPVAIVQDWIRVGNAMIGPLRGIIAHHMIVESSGPIILEGDGILPASVNPNTFKGIAGLETNNFEEKVRAVYLVEEDEGEIQKNLLSRSRSLVEADEEIRVAFAQASQRYGQWLIQEALRNQIPVLQTRPKETIVKRLKQVI
jgi:2-phosphoglycerate kinase